MKALCVLFSLSLAANVVLLHRIGTERKQAAGAIVSARHDQMLEDFAWSRPDVLYWVSRTCGDILNVRPDDRDKITEEWRLRYAARSAEAFINFGKEYPDSDHLRKERKLTRNTGNTRAVSIARYLREHGSEPEHARLADALEKLMPVTVESNIRQVSPEAEPSESPDEPSM